MPNAKIIGYIEENRMKDVLQEICAWKKIEVEQQKYELPAKELYAIVERKMTDGIVERSMSSVLASSSSGIIAEFKRKSPSKGWIKEEGRADVIPASYAQNGASALSILTDEKYFGGNMKFIEVARPTVDIPILRKEFIVDEYQLFQARRIQADAVLLIAACLTKDETRSLIHLAHELKLEVLLELHNEKELDYCDFDADLIGINNRDLGCFHTDVQHSFAMIDRLPKDCVKVSESGISNPNTVSLLRKAGFRGFLMGEHFMRAANPGAALKEFIAEI